MSFAASSHDSVSSKTRWRFIVAPMMGWSDRHCRFFHRLFSQRARLYTEMVTANAILYGPRDRLLGFSPQEKPLVLQLGGSDPKALATAARIGQDYGYDEINLNAGCPSERTQKGAFGAAMMWEPEQIGACLHAMKNAVTTPVTLKCRIGVDDQDVEEALDAAMRQTRASGADAIVVHARKAWLKGLNPKENRSTPPLDYARVLRLKEHNADFPVILNGGLETLPNAATFLETQPEGGPALDGVMIGRAAYHYPEILFDVDPLLFGQAPPAASICDILDAFIPYVEENLTQEVPLHAMTRHILGLFRKMRGARDLRRRLAENDAHDAMKALYEARKIFSKNKEPVLGGI